MIEPALAQQIAAHVEQIGVSEQILQDLRGQYPDIMFTYCMDDDINTPAPVMECKGFNVYLVDGRQHCLCLTRNYDIASGIVLAEVIEDNDD